MLRKQTFLNLKLQKIQLHLSYETLRIHVDLHFYGAVSVQNILYTDIILDSVVFKYSIMAFMMIGL